MRPWQYVMLYLMVGVLFLATIITGRWAAATHSICSEVRANQYWENENHDASDPYSDWRI